VIRLQRDQDLAIVIDHQRPRSERDIIIASGQAKFPVRFLGWSAGLDGLGDDTYVAEARRAAYSFSLSVKPPFVSPVEGVV
jgi:hypothetical protein